MALVPTKKIPQLPPAVLPLNGGEMLEAALGGISYSFSTRALVLPTDSLVTMSGMAGSLPGSRQLASSATIQVLDGGAGGQVQLVATGAAPGTLPDGLVAIAPPAGLLNNYALALDVGYLDINTAAGAVNLTGIAPALGGQVLVISNTGPNLLQLMSLNGGSLPANQFRLPFDMALTQNGSISLRYSAAIGRWVQL